MLFLHCKQIEIETHEKELIKMKRRKFIFSNGKNSVGRESSLDHMRGEKVGESCFACQCLWMRTKKSVSLVFAVQRRWVSRSIDEFYSRFKTKIQKTLPEIWRFHNIETRVGDSRLFVYQRISRKFSRHVTVIDTNAFNLFPLWFSFLNETNRCRFR